MKTIEDFFNDNLEEISTTQTLDSGHRERMEAKLKALKITKIERPIEDEKATTKVVLKIRPKPPRAKRFTLWVASAAGVAAVIAIAMVARINTTPSLTAEEQEIIEVREYYQMQVDNAKGELLKVLSTKDSETRTEIENELNEIERDFKNTALAITLYNNDSERYIALTMRMYESKRETINHITQILQ